MYGVYMCVCYYWTAATARVIIIIWFRTRVLRDVYILGMPRVDTVCRYSNIYNIQSENSSTRDGLGYEILYSAGTRAYLRLLVWEIQISRSFRENKKKTKSFLFRRNSHIVSIMTRRMPSDRCNVCISYYINSYNISIQTAAFVCTRHGSEAVFFFTYFFVFYSYKYYIYIYMSYIILQKNHLVQNLTGGQPRRKPVTDRRAAYNFELNCLRASINSRCCRYNTI